MADKYAYRASANLAAAIRRYDAAWRTFHKEVIGSWDQAHPETPSAWLRLDGVDPECVGFKDVDSSLPAPRGLSRNREREYLIPKRAGTGRPWREAMDMLNARPQLKTVVKQFGIEPAIWMPDAHRVYYMGLHSLGSEIYFTWGGRYPAPTPGDLISVRLSEYYAALEAHEAAKAALDASA